MSVYEMARELGKKLSTTEEYQGVLATQKAVAMDKEARDLIREFQSLQQSYQRMQMMGHQLSEENIATLEELEKNATANLLVKEYLGAQALFYEVVNEVNENIQAGLKGIEADTPDQDSCSCSSNESGACGGSCSGC